MEYLWLILVVIGLPILLLLRALRRLHDEPAVGFRHDIYEGRVQQAVRKVTVDRYEPLQEAAAETEPIPELVQKSEIPEVTHDEHGHTTHPQPENPSESLPDKRRALIQALLLSEVLKPRSK